MALTESHEKSEAWKQVWYLTQKDDGGAFLYRKGLTLAEREELLSTFYDFLDYERAVKVGDRLGAIDTTPAERDAKEKAEKVEVSVTTPISITPAQFDVLPLHDPANYSFGENKKWIPFAKDGKSGAKRGQYAKGYPTGLVVHWTAGHRNGLEAGNELMRNTGMLYLIGDKDGNLGQSDPLTHHGYHAGVSSHKYANGYVSDEYAGIELQAAGTLTRRDGKLYSWFNTVIPEIEAIQCARRENIAPGIYHIYTEKQMLLIRKLVCWLYLNNPSVFSIDRVVGHDEVSPGRKTDPGGSVVHENSVLTMSELRKLCWNDVDKIKELQKKS